MCSIVSAESGEKKVSWLSYLGFLLVSGALAEDDVFSGFPVEPPAAAPIRGGSCTTSMPQPFVLAIHTLGDYILVCLSPSSPSHPLLWRARPAPERIGL